MRNKKELRDLLADGQLGDAVSGALEYAEAAGDADTLNGLIALQSDFSKHRDGWHSGQISFEEFARAQARITSALLGRIHELPDAPTPAAARLRIREDRFKWRFFYLFLIFKLLVFFWVVFNWRTKGFEIAQAFVLFNALLPGMVISTALMFRSLFRASLESDAPRRYVARRFSTFTWVMFGAYLLVQCFLVVQKVNGNLSFEVTSVAFISVESALSLFMGEIVEGVFKKEK